MAFSITHAAFEGFRTIKRNPLTVIVWIAASLLLVAAMAATAWGLLADDFAYIGKVKHLDQPDIWPFLARFGGAIAALLVLCVLGTAIIYNAIFRAVLRPEERGFAYLRLGGDEVRAVGLYLLIAVLVYAFVGLVVGAIVAVAYTSVPIGLKVALGISAGLAGFILLLWVSVRLLPAYAMVVGERRIDLGRAWRLSRGKFWPLLGMLLLVAVLGMVIQMVSQIATGPLFAPLSVSLAGADGPRGFEGVADALRDNVALFVIGAVVAAAAYTLQFVLSASSYAAAYRDLSATDSAEPV